MKNTLEKRILILILLPFLLILGALVEYIVHLHITLSGAAELKEVRSATVLAAVVVMCAVVCLGIVWRYVKNKISKPVQDLTRAAEHISQGSLDMTFPYITGSNGEIAVMSEALYRMMEQLRIHKIKQEQAQSITAAQLQFNLFIKEAAGVPEAFRMTAALIRYQYDAVKIRIVYANAGTIYSLTRHGAEIEETEFSAYDSETRGRLLIRLWKPRQVSWLLSMNAHV